MPKNNDTDNSKIRCIRCGSANQGNFYQTKDKNRGYFAKIPYCKDCIKEMWQNI